MPNLLGLLSIDALRAPVLVTELAQHARCLRFTGRLEAGRRLHLMRFGVLRLETEWNGWRSFYAAMVLHEGNVYNWATPIYREQPPARPLHHDCLVVGHSEDLTPNDLYALLGPPGKTKVKFTSEGGFRIIEGHHLPPDHPPDETPLVT